MAGHSRWHNIKHRKAISDAKRGKAWSKCVRMIMVAARNGGGDPESNLTLRYAIDDARYENVPRDTIERAIKKGSGELVGEEWENVRYEGYGPGGVAIIADALTNNRTRTAGDLRLIFSKHAGNLGTSGCVGYMFEQKGQITVKGPTGPGAEERVFEAAVGAGALDVAAVEGQPEHWLVTTAPTDFHAIKSALESGKLTVTEARLVMLPTTTVEVTGENARNTLELIEALEDNDDVQKVYSNFDISESEIAALGLNG